MALNNTLTGSLAYPELSLPVSFTEENYPLLLGPILRRYFEK